MSQWEEDFPDDEVEKSPATIPSKPVEAPAPDVIPPPDEAITKEEELPSIGVSKEEEVEVEVEEVVVVAEKPTDAAAEKPTDPATKTTPSKLPAKWPPTSEDEGNKIATSDDIINEQEVWYTIIVWKKTQFCCHKKRSLTKLLLFPSFSNSRDWKLRYGSY